MPFRSIQATGPTLNVDQQQKAKPDGARRPADVPGKACIELKSLKYYVTSYRSVGIFQEHATAKIAEDLFKVLSPARLTVETVYNVRGGFLTTCTVRLPA